MQDSAGNGAVMTMVWGTDINVTDVQRQFSNFVRSFKVQMGTDAEGLPELADEAKYMSYLKDVRFCCHLHKRTCPRKTDLVLQAT